MPSEPELKHRPRITDVAFDETLVKGILNKNTTTRDEWLIRVLNMKNQIALASVEEAIARLAGHSDVDFFQPEGKVSLEPSEQQKATEKVLDLARQGKLLENIVLTQSIMACVGKSNNVSLLVQLGKISPKEQIVFQILGIQMQIAVMTGIVGI